MKKVILEEVDRIREIMGFIPLITEGIGDEAIGVIGGLIRSDNDVLINNFVKSLKKSDGSLYLDNTGKQIDSWGELTRYADLTKQQVDDLVPGFTDDLFDYFLKGTEEQQKAFRRAAVDNYFNEAMKYDFNLWDDMKMSINDSEVFRQDMLAIIDDIQNPKIKQAVEESGFGKKLRGLEPRKGELSSPGGSLDLEIAKLKKNSNKPDYVYTEKDWKNIRNAFNSGILERKEYEALVSKKLPKFGEMWKLYDKFRVAAKSGKKNAPKTFEEYLLKELEYKIPSKLSQTNVKILKKIAMPFEAVFLGNNSAMSATKGALILGGLGLGGPAGEIILDLANVVYGMLVKGADKTEDLDYTVNAPLAWEEYWKSDNPQKSLDGGETNDNIYAKPDGYNVKFATETPKIKIISADENIVRIVGDKISLGGKLYDTVYFRMAAEVGGKGESSMLGNVSVIEPFEASPANAGAGTQQQQQQQQQQTQQQTFAKWIKETMDYDPSDYKITSGSDADGTVTIDVDGTEYTANLIDNKWQWNQE
jgi:hypothetical protein